MVGNCSLSITRKGPDITKKEHLISTLPISNLKEPELSAAVSSGFTWVPSPTDFNRLSVLALMSGRESPRKKEPVRSWVG